MENFKLQAKTFYGFESILAQELRELGAADIKIKNRLVEFKGDLGFLYKANYSLRTALRILMPIATFRANNEKELYQNAKNFHWENYLGVHQSFLIDATVNSKVFTHSHYAGLKLKDAIVDRFREKTGKRPSIDKQHPHLRIHLHISSNRVSLALDSSGEPLFKRGYRVETGNAPMNEVMAAGLLKMAGWDGKGNFLDPMCGSGTLLIEAAMMAAKIPPQIHRKHFSFMNWKNFDASFYDKIRNTRLAKIEDFHGKIVGYDINMMMTKIAERNIKSADLEEFITLKQLNFFQSKKELSPVLIVFNPPYGERMEIKTTDFYQKIGETLKNEYPNTLAWMITSDLEDSKSTGLIPSQQIKLYNGKLECNYIQFEIYG